MRESEERPHALREGAAEQARIPQMHDKINIVRRDQPRPIPPRDWDKIINDTHTFEMGRMAKVLHTFTEKGFAYAPPLSFFCASQAFADICLNPHVPQCSSTLRPKCDAAHSPPLLR